MPPPSGASVTVAGPPASCSVNTGAAVDAGEHADRRVVQPRQARSRTRQCAERDRYPDPHRLIVGVADDARDPDLRAAARHDQRRHAGAVARDRHGGDLRRPGPGIGHRELQACGRRTPQPAEAVRAGRSRCTRTGLHSGRPGRRARRSRPTPPSAGTRATEPSTSRTAAKSRSGETWIAAGRHVRHRSRQPGDGVSSSPARNPNPSSVTTSGGPVTRVDRVDTGSAASGVDATDICAPVTPAVARLAVELGLHAVEGRRIRPAAPHR